jgi:thiol-disulfide isomerase/thioredoxin
MPHRRVWIGIAVLVAVQGAAVGLYLARKPPRSAPFAAETLTVRDAPELAFERSDGTRGTLSDLRGKTVLVHFWATWCAPCRSELPGLIATATALERSGTFELVAVSVDDEWDQMRTYFDAHIPRAAVRPTTAGIHHVFGVSTLPDTYMVDASGRLVARYAGARDWTTEVARAHLTQAIEVERAKR